MPASDDSFDTLVDIVAQCLVGAPLGTSSSSRDVHLVEVGPRRLVGIGGPIAVGKSTLAARLRAELVSRSVVTRADVVSTDSFLYPNSVLEERGLSLQKGAPQTYDLTNLESVLERLRSGAPRVQVPRYSHEHYDIVDGEDVLEAGQLVLLEGLHVAHVASALDLVVYLDADESFIESWFVQRFEQLVAAAAAQPDSFYAGFSDLDAAALGDVARWTWRELNWPTVSAHVLDTRADADVVVSVGAAHEVVSVDQQPRR